MEVGIGKEWIATNKQVLRLWLARTFDPKLLLKESTIAELLPSASTFLNTFVGGCFICQVQAVS